MPRHSSLPSALLAGLNFNGSLAQQQAAVASALASQQNLMDLEKLKALVPPGLGGLSGIPPHLLAALSSYSPSPMNGKPNGQSSQPSMAQPPRLKVCSYSHPTLPHPTPTHYKCGR